MRPECRSASRTAAAGCRPCAARIAAIPPAKKPPFHEASFILAFTQRLGIPLTLEEGHPWLYVDPAERGSGCGERTWRQIGAEGPLFAVHPGCAGSSFDWPVESYFAAIERLARSAGYW